jgi:hypothetical protein
MEYDELLEHPAESPLTSASEHQCRRNSRGYLEQGVIQLFGRGRRLKGSNAGASDEPDSSKAKATASSYSFTVARAQGNLHSGECR